MDNITKAYLTFVLTSIVLTVLQYVFPMWDVVISLVLSFAFLIVSSKFISADAIERGLSKKSGYWCLLGVIGIFIYHVFIAKSAKSVTGVLGFILIIIWLVIVLVPSHYFVFTEEQCDFVYPFSYTDNIFDMTENLKLNSECKLRFAEIKPKTDKYCDSLEKVYIKSCYFQKVIVEKDPSYCYGLGLFSSCAEDAAKVLGDDSFCDLEQLIVNPGRCREEVSSCSATEGGCEARSDYTCESFSETDQEERYQECLEFIANVS